MSYSTRRSHGGFNKGSPIQKPVEVGKQYEVDVTEISRKGDGIAKIQGFVIFVENGKVGNKIKVEKLQQMGYQSHRRTSYKEDLHSNGNLTDKRDNKVGLRRL